MAGRAASFPGRYSSLSTQSTATQPFFTQQQQQQHPRLLHTQHQPWTPQHAQIRALRRDPLCTSQQFRALRKGPFFSASRTSPLVTSQQFRSLRTGREDGGGAPERPEQQPPRKAPLSRLGLLAGVGSILLAKGKYVLVALKLTKATPLVSMVLTSATYR
jgi:hypothetical protein